MRVCRVPDDPWLEHLKTAKRKRELFADAHTTADADPVRTSDKEVDEHEKKAKVAHGQGSASVDLRTQMMQYVQDHAVQSTKKTYESSLKSFRSFCAERQWQSFPTSPEVIATFLRFLLEDKKLSRSAINTAKSAIASEYKLTKMESPTKDPLIKEVMKVVARSTPAAKQKKPLTIDLLKRITKDSNGSWIDRRDDFMLVLLMAGALRESEEMALRMLPGEHDVFIDTMEVKGRDTEVLFVFVEKGKTDQERKGHLIAIGPALDPSICPIALFKQWMACRDAESKFLFHGERSTDKLNAKTPNGRLKARLRRIGVDPNEYGSHSGRRGMMTAAAAAGVQERLLRKHGNWKSDCIYRYIDESLENRLSVGNSVFGAIQEGKSEKKE